jgi:H/ACA ribonucleoprotein complex subunit 4
MTQSLPFESMDRSFLVKSIYSSDDSLGMIPSLRNISEMLNYGIINIDKPSGPTSHQVSAYVKGIVNAQKAGHSGTLDPAVTGVLPTGLNKATRIMQWLLTAGKEYVCLMHLHKPLPKEEILRGIERYTGRIMQLPPVKSAVKRQIRERSVYYVDVLDMQDQDILFRIGCQAGTYIRKWVHDFGLSVGTNAHMVELRRTRAGPFDESTLVTLQDLNDAFYYYVQEHDESLLRKMILTPEYAVSHLRKVYIMDSAVDSLCHGAFLKVPGIVKLEKSIIKNDIVAVFTMKNELVLVGKALMDAESIISSEKGVAVKTEQVFMDTGIYPKMELHKDVPLRDS